MNFISMIMPSKVKPTRGESNPEDTYKSVSRMETALEKRMGEMKAENFLRETCDEYRKLYLGLNEWRANMNQWERMSEGDFSHRTGSPMQDGSLSIGTDIFRKENGTMGLSTSYVDFMAAQAKSDLYGTSPWMAATPEGSDDTDLAERITKNCQWKFNHSNLEQAMIDADRIACWGGTAFVKPRWERCIEEYAENVPAAWHIPSKQFIAGADGDYVTEQENLQAILDEHGVDGAEVEWKDVTIDRTDTVYDNLRVDVLDHRDIAFEPKAQYLDLAYTDVFHRFRIGLLDAIRKYDIPKEHHELLKQCVVQGDEEVRPERGESNNTDKTPNHDDDGSNPQITLLEGFRRADPFGTGKLIRIHCVFSDIAQFMFRCDYLRNVTPGGIMPVFPKRIHKIPRRIFGVGYFEKTREDNDAVDRHHNTVTHRNSLSSNVIVAFQPDALEDDSEGRDGVIDHKRPFILKKGMTINDAFSFAQIPDANNRSIELLNQRLQMSQIRTGISTAVQGELKGVPQANTATGTMAMQSRGALLLKDPIDQLAADTEKVIEYAVHLKYAHHDVEETFTWGEGKDAELLSIKPGDVAGLRMNVSMTLAQSQSQTKLENARNAIMIAREYAQLPETEKVAQRTLYVQAIRSLGFHEAEDVIREAVTDPMAILALVPVEMQQALAAAMAQVGLMEAESPEAAPDAAGGAVASDVPMANPQDAPLTEP